MTWLYSRICIPNIEDIRTELIFACAELTAMNTGVMYNPLYVNFYAPDFLPHVPKLAKFLEDNNILWRLQRCMFAKTNATVPNRIHIDSANGAVKYSINIPLIDCNNTYTAFYQPLPMTANPAKAFLIAADESTAVEIDRVECSTPLIINTNIPHMGISARPMRQMAFLRFWPEFSHTEVEALICALQFNT
jgi:hypothetical protein